MGVEGGAGGRRDSREEVLRCEKGDGCEWVEGRRWDGVEGVLGMIRDEGSRVAENWR